MAAFPTPNARVWVEATFFYASNGPLWSELTFGAGWADACVLGSVLSIGGEKSVVRFEDGDKLAIPNETLRAKPHAGTN
jgi:hypothetical protein